eukprot:CAMPEP_0194405826 /NCGR_PEP_ID=MMETSP0176-20130528/4158_1 /TAXON_ID=216777 /ORGANISM="Proboscia alata, Strain PI-D3" /LENGTH=69 /DNA_ID=CAMNT_0039204795 /DNA_START=68 /DNA_END=273 /DNA_ORIENTATION=-
MYVKSLEEGILRCSELGEDDGIREILGSKLSSLLGVEEGILLGSELGNEDGTLLGFELGSLLGVEEGIL